MTFLTPWSAVFAAAAAIPCLLLLYMLRLRRQRMTVPTTLLWVKSFEDLQANVPFQRLRWSLLLFLQLMILLLLLFAAAQPVIGGGESVAPRIVLLIDRSASMKAAIRHPNGENTTRLDAAKTAAKQMVSDLTSSGEPHEIMIIGFGAEAQVISPFETNRRVLFTAIDSVQAYDEIGNLAAALELASAFSVSNEETDNPQADVVLLSDGGVTLNDQANTQPALSAGRFRFVQVVPEQAAENVGITAISARRDEENASRLLVFARLISTRSSPTDVVVTLKVGDQAVSLLRRTIPPATDLHVGEVSISHELELPGDTILSLRHNFVDEFATDDEVWLVIPEPGEPRIAFVHPDDSAPDQFLLDLILAMEPQSLDVLTAATFSEASEPWRDKYDLLIFDRVASQQWPELPSLTFGAQPQALNGGELSSSSQEGQPMLSWNRHHPLMRQVGLDTIVFVGGAFTLPTNDTRFTVLASGENGPVIAEYRPRISGGIRHVFISFEFRRSNWPLHVSSAVFMQNIIDVMASTYAQKSGIQHRPGEIIDVRSTGGVDNITMRYAAAGVVLMKAQASNGTASLTLPPTVGLYSLEGAETPSQHVAVNLVDESESDIRPRQEVSVRTQSVSARQSGEDLPRPLWPWLVGAALALMVIEWLVYSSRVRGA